MLSAVNRYNPQSSVNSVDIEAMCSFIDFVSMMHYLLFVVGDCNLPDIKWVFLSALVLLPMIYFLQMGLFRLSISPLMGSVLHVRGQLTDACKCNYESMSHTYSNVDM